MGGTGNTTDFEDEVLEALVDVEEDEESEGDATEEDEEEE